MAQDRFALSAEEAAWFKTLKDRLWQENPSPGNVHGNTYWTDIGKLTADEWERLKASILSHDLPCLPSAGVFGFGFCLNVYGHSDTPGMKPDPLISITGNHLPDVIDPGNAQNWNFIWATFEPFTHSPRNRELLKLYGFGEPGDRLDYEY